MCHFITATLPRSVDIGKTEQVFANHKLRFEQIENESVRKYLEAGDLYILTTQGMCDCGTVLGSGYRAPALSSEEKEKYRQLTVEKFKKKGWSDTKILRWFREAELTENKEARNQELAHESSMVFATNWVNFIADVLDSRISPRIGLLVHSYSGGLDGRIAITEKKQIPRKDLDEDLLLQMAEDVIYDFVL